MKTLLIAGAMLLGFTTASLPATVEAKTCVQYCTVGKTKPCGDACIPNWKMCRKDWTRACPDSERPAKEKEQEKVPVHQEERGA